MVAYYAQYGYNVDEYDTELQASVAQETVQSKLSTAIVRHYAAENGYELTEEKKAELAAQVQTALDNTREYLESYLSASGYTGDELTQAVEDQLTQAGYSEESLMETAELNDVLNYLYEKATADIAVTEDEVKAAFDEKVATQKENYADLDTFINDYVNENEILYTPEGVRLMECIYIAKVDGEATEDEATKAEATPGRIHGYRGTERLCQGEGCRRVHCGRRGLRGSHEGLQRGQLHRRADAARLSCGRGQPALWRGIYRGRAGA